MGTLKPGVTYIYERDGSNIYAREFGSSDRQLVGAEYKSPTKEKMEEDMLWNEIRREAATNLSLQAELERVKMLYYLIRDNNGILHHPV